MPLLINLILAALVRAAVPYTVAEGGERYRYYLMAQFYPIQDCAAFHCFRMLPPMLASRLPFGTIDAFLVTGVLGHAAAGTMLWLIAERLHGSRRVAFFASCAYWLTWGPMHSFSDPLLIADPLQALFSFTGLYLLLTERYAAALPLFVLGAAVKEGVLLVPAIYALYAWVVSPRTVRRSIWLASLVTLPVLTWLVLRIWLKQRFGYDHLGDLAYLRNLSTISDWLPAFGPAPARYAWAIAYLYGTYGGIWVLCVLGLRGANRDQRILTLASIPAMAFLAIQQSPERALAVFPYAVAVPAALWLARAPWMLAAAFLVSNAALVVAVRRGADYWWLPRVPVAVGATVALIVLVAAVRARPDAVHEAVARGSGRAVRRERGMIAGAAAALLVCGVMIVRPIAHRVQSITFTAGGGNPVPALDDGGTPALAVSPDGSRVVYVAATSGSRELWMRRIDQAVADRLDHTLRASEPFWSADARSIGFFADGGLMALDEPGAGGTSRRLADAPAPLGAAWNAGGDILFAPSFAGGLFRVAASGGPATPLTTIDPARGEVGHAWPSFLPDGDHFVFLVRGRTRAETGLHLGSMRDGSHAPIVDLSQPPAHAVFNAVYAPPGLLLFARDDGLWIQPFDARRRQATAGRIQFADGLIVGELGRGAFALGGGTLAFATRNAAAPGSVSISIWSPWQGAFVDRGP